MQDRFPELTILLAEGDLSRLSRRMADYCADFAADEPLIEAVNAFRAAYNAFSVLPQAEATEEKHRALLQRAKSILDGIAPKGDAAIAGAPQSFPEETVVFAGKGIRKEFFTPKYTFKLPSIDLALRTGEVTGIVGENGNGKTTLLRIVAGDLAADGGDILYPAFQAKQGDWYAIKQQIAYMPQQVRPWNGFLRENLAFTAAIHGLRGSANDRAVDFIIHRLGLSRYAEALWSEVSGGYKLRFELARALVWRPMLLVIDEPLAHLDINTQQVFLQDIRYLTDSLKFPMTTVLSSQHLHEVESIADNIVFIRNGEALYNGAIRDFARDRSENLFEIGTEAPKAGIEAAIASIEGARVEDAGQYFIVHTPVHVTAVLILHLIAAHSIEIAYFRNISASTLRLFREHAVR